MKAKIQFEIYAPTDCSEAQFIEWLNYHLGATNEIETINPLMDYQLVAVNLKIKIE